MARKSQTDPDLVLSFQAVRQALGYLGWFLPLSLLAFAWIGGYSLEGSISDFYYTSMGGILTGTLSAIGIFLVAYRGYDPAPGEFLSDRWLSAIAGIAALGIALLPVHRHGYPVCVDAPQLCWRFGITSHPELLHYGAAIIFFSCLALFSVLQFPQGERDADGRLLWTVRSFIFLGCGTVIVAMMVAILPYFLTDPETRARLSERNYLFWTESLATVAFATSWLTKGRALTSLTNTMQRLGGGT
ncbi:hypothetical protein DEA8626_02934 [Defluviimonas aquaemixtae]|uniref:DUF998 domain-containing protein n=1 Tax=Albidovulum aquaemixtae TaxID=1542388 RepID=A0A2R8BKN2_9RHOB|nr:hypothetical protein [Defluviimonas aquaemixtae]SPH23863.1 hypothetical protein DEA8626_02934 [Defluviimonas aquaemixtae]